MKLLFKFLVPALFFILPVFANAQSQEKSFSLLILNFAKNIQWPKHANANSFTIGVYSYAPLMSELQKSSDHQRISGKQIVLKEINYPDEATGCDLLFIPSFKSKKIPEIKKVLSDSPVLLVTNTFENNTLGSNINIILKEGKLTYEIYKASMEAKQMKIPSVIRNTGIIINR